MRQYVSRNNVYEFGDKSSGLLAMQSHQVATTRNIIMIQSDTGEKLIDLNDINKAFLQFYSNLHTSELSNDPGPSCAFFDNLTIPNVSEKQNTNLGADISAAEISMAMKSMQSNKSPGPDGFITK